MKGKLFLLVFMFILLVASVSAFEFDNNLTYSKNDMKVDFDNVFGLGKYFGSIELKSHNNVNHIKEVATGNQTVMYYDFENWKEIYKDGLGEVIFIDMNNGEIIERDYWFVYWGDKERDVREKGNCTLDSNGQEECEWIITGTEIVKDWLPYNSKDIPKENIRIGLRTNVEVGDHFDGVWTIIGKKVKKHTEWTASLNVGLVAYYAFEHLSGGVEDGKDGVRNGTNSGADRGTSGQIGNAFDYITANNDYVNLTSGSTKPLMHTTFSVSYWFNADDVTTNQRITGFKETYNFHSRLISGNLVFNFQGEASETTIDAVSINTWYHVVITYDGSDATAYLDNVSKFSGAKANNAATRSNIFGAESEPSSGWYDGTLDELGIWNRTLSAGEVGQLWNGGTGITFTDNFDVAPVVTNTFPPNGTTFTDRNIVTFNGTASDDSAIINVSLYLDAVLTETNSSGFSGTNYLFTSGALSEGDHDWFYSAWDDSNPPLQTNGTGMRFTIDTAPSIFVVSPIENTTNFTTSTVFFNATSNQDIDTWIVNYNGTNHTLTAGINTSLEVEDGINFQLLLYANSSISGVLALNDTIWFSVDTVAPENLNITAPFGLIDYHVSGEGLKINWNVSNTNLDVCRLQFGGANTTVTCSDNTTTIASFTNISATEIILFANDTFGNSASFTRNFDFLVFQNARFFNSTSFETAKETLTLNVTTNGTTPTDLLFSYNGTNSSGTITNIVGSNYNFSASKIVPLGSGNKTWSYFFKIGSQTIKSTDNQQNISGLNFAKCNSTLTSPFINFTFADEGNSSAISASIPASTFTYYLTDTTVTKTFTYTNNTQHSHFDFCGFPSRTITTNYSLQYEGTNYPQRITSKTKSLTNSTTTEQLFLLKTIDGSSVTFQVINVAQQPISGVSVNATRDISGSPFVVETGTTDSAGSVNFFLHPSFDHDFGFTKEGFPTLITSLRPTESSYTITLGVTSIIATDHSKGINTTILPSRNKFLINNTNTNFNFSLDSSFNTVTQFGFVLKNSTGNIFNTTSATTNGGLLNVVLNTGNNTDLIMQYYWIINDTYTNASVQWFVFDSTGSGYGINTFFTNLNTHIGSGLFGLDSFGKSLLAFIIIFLVTGIFSLKFGLQSPVPIAGILVVLTWFFSVVVALIPNPPQAPNVPVAAIFITMIFVALLFREAPR